jgi:hypothetical protein
VRSFPELSLGEACAAPVATHSEISKERNSRRGMDIKPSSFERIIVPASKLAKKTRTKPMADGKRVMGWSFRHTKREEILSKSGIPTQAQTAFFQLASHQLQIGASNPLTGGSQ